MKQGVYSMIKYLLAMLFTVTSLNAASGSVKKINGAGASFPYPLYSKWISEYTKQNPETQINYQSIGSGGGIRQVQKETVDFGASDAPMKDDDLKKVSFEIKHIPTVLGAVVVAYNIKGIEGQLNLDGDTLSKIFLGKITKWNDPAIVAMNKTATLPKEDILIVHRADGSGTTSIFSEYLSKISADWKSSVGEGKTLEWPVGIGAKGNEGVTAMIKQTSGAIGYIGLEYALTNDIAMAKLKNKKGEFVNPSVDAVSKSAAGIKNFDGDMRMSITDADAKGAYPISAFTYILLPLRTNNAEALDEVKKFVKWGLTLGQAMAPELNYAPLPVALRDALLERIK